MALPASAVSHRARRAGARAARALSAVAVASTMLFALPADALAQENGGPIVIAGPGEKNPADLQAMAERVAAPAPGAASVARAAASSFTRRSDPRNDQRNDGDRFTQAAHADGAIVIPGAGDAGITSGSPPVMPATAAAAPGIVRVSMQPTARQVMPVVVTPAASRQTAGAQPVAANPPANVGFDSLASRGEPPQLRAAAARNGANGPVTPMQPQPQAQAASQAQAQAQAQPVAPGQQDGELIRRSALAFLQQQSAGLPGKVEITVATVFPRGLAACTTLEPFMPTGARLWGRTTIGMRCAGEHPWTLYLQAKISIQATYYLASRAIAPGELLSAGDLVARDGDLTLLPQAVITDPSQAVGSVSLMRVSAGLPLRRDMLKSASMVTIGQTVKVVAQGQGFAISAEGSAMNNASPGQPVRVKTAGGQVIQGVVKDGGTVEIQL